MANVTIYFSELKKSVKVQNINISLEDCSKIEICTYPELKTIQFTTKAAGQIWIMFKFLYGRQVLFACLTQFL